MFYKSIKTCTYTFDESEAEDVPHHNIDVLPERKYWNYRTGAGCSKAD
jgi:tRNA A37 N6-isopentenylltransferase MiaA